MPTLTETQQALQQYILHNIPGAAPMIAPCPGPSVERRLAIYYSGYRQRLIEALSTDFETLAAVLGQARFREMCEAYVEATPSGFRNIRWYGGELPEFLLSVEPWRQHVELAEIARFEWTLTLAFDAADRSVLGFEDLSRLPPDAWSALQLELHPSLHLIVLRTNAPALRIALENDLELPQIQRSETAVYWAVWRKQGNPHFRSLSPHERWCIESVLQGKSFSALCEGLSEFTDADEAPALAASLLRTWVDDELIVGAAHSMNA